MKDVISFAHPQYIPMEYIGTEYLSNIHFFLEDAFFFPRNEKLSAKSNVHFCSPIFQEFNKKNHVPRRYKKDLGKRIGKCLNINIYMFTPEILLAGVKS